MYEKLEKLIVYRNIDKNSILFQVARIIRQFEEGLRIIGQKDAPASKENMAALKEQAAAGLYEQVHRLLDVATEYGFDENLWQNYLSFLLATVENPFSLTCEKAGAKEGSVVSFAKNDFEIFRQLFHYDFGPLEESLGIDCFSVLTHYRAIAKNERSYNHNVSEKVRELSRQIAAAPDADSVFTIVTDFYERYGVGKFGMNKAFRVRHEDGQVVLLPITNTEEVRLSDLVGYEIQKQKLVENTLAFVEGRKANNVLLFGDSGTGKSTSVKAILNEYYGRGLRMIEIYKHQFEDLSTVISQIKNRNYRFIIYMDDLSFEEFEVEYKFLKAVIEGGLETKPDNVLIYATSNRRHLIRETWGDRSDLSQDELHRSDTMQEKLSLVARFGVTINYSAPAQKEYFEIVKQLAARQGIDMPEEELLQKANIWEMSHGGRSGRTAEQFITYLTGIFH